MENTIRWIVTLDQYKSGLNLCKSRKLLLPWVGVVYNKGMVKNGLVVALAWTVFSTDNLFLGIKLGVSGTNDQIAWNLYKKFIELIASNTFHREGLFFRA